MGRYSPTVLPWVGQNPIGMAADTISDTIDSVRKQRQQDEENRRANAYLSMAKGAEGREIQRSKETAAGEGFFDPAEMENRIGLTTPTPRMSTTESHGIPSQGAPNLAQNRMTFPSGYLGKAAPPPASSLAPDLAGSIGQVRQQRAAAAPPDPATTPATSSGRPAAGAVVTPDHSQVHFQMVGSRVYMPGLSKESMANETQEAIYDARTRATEARKDLEREREIADIMGSMQVDHATAAGIQSKALSSTDVMGGNAQRMTDAKGLVWEYNRRTKRWDKAITEGGGQLTGPLPYSGYGGAASAASGLRALVDDTHAAAVTARKRVPTERPPKAKPSFMVGGKTIDNPIFDPGLEKSFVRDSTRLDKDATQKERDADRALQLERNQVGIGGDPSDDEPAGPESGSTYDIRGNKTDYVDPDADPDAEPEPAAAAPAPAKKVDEQAERASAAKWIKAGKDSAAVKAMFKKRTGKDY